MILNFAKFSTQTNTFHWKIFPLSTKFQASFSILINCFPLENILQASKTFVLFICSLHKTRYFFLLIYCITLFALVESSAKEQAYTGIPFVP